MRLSLHVFEVAAAYRGHLLLWTSCSPGLHLWCRKPPIASVAEGSTSLGRARGLTFLGSVFIFLIRRWYMAPMVFLEPFMEQHYLAHLSQRIWPGVTFLYHSEFLVFWFFSWAGALPVCAGWYYFDVPSFRQYLLFFETSLPTSYPTTFLAWCCLLLLNAIPGKAREKGQAHQGGECWWY